MTNSKTRKPNFTPANFDQFQIGGDSQDGAVLAARDALYQQAKANHPERWSGTTRNWEKNNVVWLNPARQTDKNLKQAA